MAGKFYTPLSTTWPRSIPVIICSVLEDPELPNHVGAAVLPAEAVVQADLLTTLDGWLTMALMAKHSHCIKNMAQIVRPRRW